LIVFTTLNNTICARQVGCPAERPALQFPFSILHCVACSARRVPIPAAAPLSERIPVTTCIDCESLTTSELVFAAQAGDREAFGELFRRFERTVTAIALRRLGDLDEAQELAQDVFIQAMTKLKQLREPECFGGWLKAITHRMAINRMVRRQPLLPTEADTLEASCVEHRTPLALALQQERSSQVQAGLQRLRDLDRQTLEAFYVRGQSLIEMSDEFEAPLGTIKRRLHVARKRLAEEVEPQLV
jgi:RNA polymerase sigma-70 factor (ECF subfamily)